MKPRLPFVVGYSLALLAGALAGWIDLHNKAVQPTAAVLLLAGGMLSFIWPRHVIAWIVLLGASIPIAHVFGQWAGVVTPYPPQPFGWDFLLPFVPAAIGAGLGILASYVVGNRSNLQIEGNENS